eukprot:TRINITY_DN4000_c0_g1_i3.p1 TRINITY_DN4000_c0_g1~~TRINITY_DN4000_c0_g1_i3.p1  ORF type:complete len:219 (-),score=43.45 TRINITY_DN4000_c0_g1_i3:887-1519(-)
MQPFLSHLLLLLLVAVAAVGAAKTTCKALCDGKGKPCSVKDSSLSLRVRLNMTKANDVNATCATKAAAFCVGVDQFSNIRVQQTGQVKQCDTMSLSVYTGAKGSESYLTSPVPFFKDNVTLCAKDAKNPTQRAVLDVLVLNVTLDGGVWKLDGSLKVGTGVVSTCDDSATCTIDPALPCIGGPKGTGTNGYCARCLDTSVATSDTTLSCG